MTALATLALVRGGGEAAHRLPVLKRAVLWLRVVQGSGGVLGFDPNHGESIYNHAWATHALAAASVVLDDAGARAAAAEAVGFCLKTQNVGLGWKYGARTGRNDTSVTATMIEALHAAHVAGIVVPEAAFAGAKAWALRATDQDGDTGYETPGGGSSFLAPNDGKFDLFPVMSAAGIVIRRRADPQAAVKLSAALVSKSRPMWHPRGLNFVHWYEGTRASALVGGSDWATWRTALVSALVPNQRHGGCASGSWDAIDEWGLAGGRVYATALNALTLTIDRE